MQETNNQVIVIIVSVLVLIIFIVLVGLLLAVYYSNTKQKLIREKEFLKTTYEKNILEAQFEIQEQTLRNASQEIHDNIGQVLSYVSLSLDRASGLDEASKNSVIAESKTLVNQSMNDLRDLSKSFSLDNIARNGLLETITNEVSRLNKSRLIKANLTTEGSAYGLGEHPELVLFRILQEFVNNTLKHAKARNLNIDLNYANTGLTLSLTDDGKGFDIETELNKNGSGLRNMRTRAGLIGAEVTASSTIGQGSKLIIQLNKAL